MRKFIISLALALGLALPVFAKPLAIKPNAPSRYQVAKGDTLWGISARYLNHPWQWPQLWQMNKTEIKKPHWIYPGDVLLLSYVNGQPRLALELNKQHEERLSPQIRVETIDKAVASIPASAIEPFLKRPLVVNNELFSLSPQIVADPNEHISISQGDKAYAVGVNEVGIWQAYRLGKPLIDPDSQQALGYEATYSGDLVADKIDGDIQTLRVKSVKEEILVGDRLIRAPLERFVNYAPHAPEAKLSGKIISIYNGVDGAAQYSTVVLNLGSTQGVEVGHVFGIYKKSGQAAIPHTNGKEKMVSLPAEQVGKVFVYRVFDKVSYALILNSNTAIYIGDGIATPELD